MDIEEQVRGLSRNNLDALLSGDAWEDNYIINTWERINHATVLESFPWRVYLPIADSCNARCEFCTSWLYGNVFLDPKILEHFSGALRHARIIDLCGYGEPLINPHFEEITQNLMRHVDRRCQMVLYSNGALLDKWIDRLLDIGVRYFAFSLNAATAATHDAVMGLGPKAFDKIVAAIRQLSASAQGRGLGITVSGSFVVTATNIHEAADFVELCNILPLTMAYLRVLGLDDGHRVLNDVSLPPYLNDRFEDHRERAIEAISASALPIYASPENWSLPVIPEREAHARTDPAAFPVRTRSEIGRTRLVHVDAYDTRLVDDIRRAVADGYRVHVTAATQHIADLLGADFRTAGVTISVGTPRAELEASPYCPDDNPFNRFAPYDCTYPYQNLLIARAMVTPCCFIRTVPGMEAIKFDGSRPFREIWNGPQMVRVRESLAHGPLLRACMRCPASRT